ncbi:MAG TPA: ATP-binding protein [Bryobacteraceae bacterium]|nr:ATP-binding protein [Bryobacteraceae bacterium]
MTFRTRLLIAFALTAIVAVAFVGAVVSTTTRRAFERLDEQRVSALAAQFHQEFLRRQREIAQRVKDIAEADSTRDMAIALSRPDAEPATYVDAAQPLAAAHNLDFLELVSTTGSIVSSAQWPARFLYQEDWVKQRDDWNSREPFLKREDLPADTALALISVRVASLGDSRGDSKLYVIGGEALDRDFLSSFVLPAGMRALLYREPQSIVGASGPLPQTAALAPLIDALRKQRSEVVRTVQWTADAASAETFHAIPLIGPDGDLMGAFLVGSSRAAQVNLERFMLRVEILVAMGGILLALLVAFWTTARITRPVEALAAGARAVAAGDWRTQVDVHVGGEIGALAAAFNRMTRELLEQRDRLVQAERVAAWRELARRLAHELKNPLFPLQITVENLQRARAAHPEQFDEVFRESTATLLAELGKLRGIVGRFSDFAKMPQPQLETVDLNGLVRDSLKLFEAQMQAAGVTLRLDLAADLRAVQADPGQLGRALQNLVLNAIDAMPSGGTLAIRTAVHEGGVRLEVSDTGQGLTQEECDRLFTPYYTTKTHGTGLGLAIVQSVISDHGGKIGVRSEPSKGTVFVIDLA